MQVQIGYTDKRVLEVRENAFSGGNTLDCKLKEPCSMQAPVFLVQGLPKGSLFNYCKFEGRYYWVDDIVYVTTHLQEVHCHIDALATYQDKIKNTYAYVKYGDKAHWNKYVDDFRFQPEKIYRTLENHYDAFAVDTSAANGTVVMTVMEFFDAQHSGVRNYAMSLTTFFNTLADLTGYLKDNLIDGLNITTLKEVMQAVAELWGAIGGAGSWRDNILAVKYLPIPLSEYIESGASNSQMGMYLGGIICNPSGYYYRLSPIKLKRYSHTILLPWHKDVQLDYYFLKNPRWSTLQVITPGGQFQEIDVTLIKSQSTVKWYSCIDLCSGEWSGKLVDTQDVTGNILASFGGNVGVDILRLAGTGRSQEGIMLSNWTRAAAFGMSGFSSSATVNATKSNSTGGTHIWSNRKSVTPQLSGTQLDTDTSNSSVTTTEVTTTGVSGSFLPSGISVGSASGSFGGGITGMFLYDINPGTGVDESYARKSIIVRLTTFAPAHIEHYVDYCDEYGYPCNDYLKIGDLSGYVCCVGACMPNDIMVSPDNQATINSCLNNGVWITPTPT